MQTRDQRDGQTASVTSQPAAQAAARQATGRPTKQALEGLDFDAQLKLLAFPAGAAGAPDPGKDAAATASGALESLVWASYQGKNLSTAQAVATTLVAVPQNSVISALSVLNRAPAGKAKYEAELKTVDAKAIFDTQKWKDQAGSVLTALYGNVSSAGKVRFVLAVALHSDAARACPELTAWEKELQFESLPSSHWPDVLAALARDSGFLLSTALLGAPPGLIAATSPQSWPPGWEYRAAALAGIRKDPALLASFEAKHAKLLWGDGAQHAPKGVDASSTDAEYQVAATEARAGLDKRLDNDPERKRFLVGLIANNPLVVADLTAATEKARPLSAKVNLLLTDAWAAVHSGLAQKQAALDRAYDAAVKAAKATDPKPVMRPLMEVGVLPKLIGLRFGLSVSGVPSFAQCELTWTSLGRVPLDQIESANSKRNNETGIVPTLTGFNDAKKPGWPRGAKVVDGWDPAADRDPLKSIKYTGAGGGGTAGGGSIEIGMSDAAARSNRHDRKFEGHKEHTGNLEDDLGKKPHAQDPTKSSDDVRKIFEDANVSQLSHAILHELGHSLDRSRGIMSGPNGFNGADWKTADSTAAKSLTESMGLPEKNGLGKGQERRARLETLVGKEGPDALFADVTTHSGMKEVWTGDAATVELENAKNSHAGKWLGAHFEKSGPQMFHAAPVAFGERVYLFKPSDEFAGWGSYKHSARVNHGVSSYQWKNHREWFAEIYATYFDTAKPGELLRVRDPQSAAALDKLAKSSADIIPGRPGNESVPKK